MRETSFVQVEVLEASIAETVRSLGLEQGGQTPPADNPLSVCVFPEGRLEEGSLGRFLTALPSPQTF